MKKSYQIQQIDNGWLFSHMPDQVLLQAMAKQQQPQAEVIYCATFDDLVAQMKKVWPLEVKK